MSTKPEIGPQQVTAPDVQRLPGAIAVAGFDLAKYDAPHLSPNQRSQIEAAGALDRDLGEITLRRFLTENRFANGLAGPDEDLVELEAGFDADYANRLAQLHLN